MTTGSKARAFYQAWYDQVWVEGNFDAVDIFMSTQTDAEGLMTDLAANAQDVKELVMAARHMMRDISCTVVKAVDADPWYWANVRIDAKRASDLKPLSFDAQAMGRIEDGKLCEVYNGLDLVTFFERLGALPENTVAMVLSGETLTIA